MKIKTLTITFLIVFALFTYGQERYKVVYDFEKDSTSYLKLNAQNNSYEPVKKPKFKRNSLVEIKLENVNPFAVEVQPKVTETNVFREGNTYNITSLFGNVGALTKTPEDLNLNIKTPNLNEVKNKDGKNIIRGDVSQTEANVTFINTLSNDIYLAKQFLMSNLINPNLKKNDIQDNILDYLDGVIKRDAGIPRSPEKDNILPFVLEVRRVLTERTRAIQASTRELVEEYQAVSQQDSLSVNKANLKSINSSILTLGDVLIDIENAESNAIENLDTIQNLYLALESSNFEQTMDKEVKLDKMNINLQFKQSSFVESIGLQRSDAVMREREIKIFAKGGLKINTSVALTLNNFGSNSKEYFVDTTTNLIGADNNDYFVPNLATMINFYPFMGEKFNVGGSFGLSIPITDDISGVNFLLGPSLFFGSDNRISMTGGIAYGSTSELRNGLDVGDSFEGDTKNLTRRVYDFGYFFGISFSLFDVKK